MCSHTIFCIWRKHLPGTNGRPRSVQCCSVLLNDVSLEQRARKQRICVAYRSLLRWDIRWAIAVTQMRVLRILLALMFSSECLSSNVCSTEIFTIKRSLLEFYAQWAKEYLLTQLKLLMEWQQSLSQMRPEIARVLGIDPGDRARSLEILSLILRFDGGDRKSTRLNSSHSGESRMPSSA